MTEATLKRMKKHLLYFERSKNTIHLNAPNALESNWSQYEIIDIIQLDEDARNQVHESLDVGDQLGELICDDEVLTSLEDHHLIPAPISQSECNFFPERSSELSQGILDDIWANSNEYTF